MSGVNFSLRGRVRVAHLSVDDVSQWLEVGPPFTVSLHPDEGGGSGYFEYSTSPNEDVIANTALWIQWDLGEVSIACSAVTEGRITAIRARCTAGGVTVEIA